jgi:hypothetical protein
MQENKEPLRSHWLRINESATAQFWHRGAGFFSKLLDPHGGLEPLAR